MIKYNKNIKSYDYILSFDLAKKITGYSLIDIKRHKVVCLGIIDMNKTSGESFWYDYGEHIKHAIEESTENIDVSKVFITKEKLPNQSGKFSSIEALQALAQCHAIFDSCAYSSGIDCYDFDGVHSVTVKAYFKNLTGIEKPTKEDIANKISSIFKYDFSDYTLDVTDSIAVALTLYDVKYNKDIKDKIRELKREIKASKKNDKINKLKEEIKFLESIL